ncbi:MAG: hypothetical protein JWN17_1657 [Frankiales bacterium]|nr:hypothetical protein [Frankiales bacterium]
MRRLLLAALLCLTALAVPVTAQAATGGPVVRLIDADSGRTVHVAPGTRIEVRLGAPQSGVWVGLERGGPTLHVVRHVANGAGLAVDLDAVSPGRYGGSSEVRPQVLSAQTDLACFHARYPCLPPSYGWSAVVVVDDGPSDATDLACTPAGRPTPTAAPEGQVVVGPEDDGATVTVALDGSVALQLDGCDRSDAPAVATTGLFRAGTAMDREHGQAETVLRPVDAGTATVTTTPDPRCAHRTDAAGAASCSPGRTSFSVTVRVLPTTYAACHRPAYEAFRVGAGYSSTNRIGAGDAVSIAGGHSYPCVTAPPEPEHDFLLQSQPVGSSTWTDLDAQHATSYVGSDHPTTSTRYRLLQDGRVLPADGEDSVVVDRVSGSCGFTLYAYPYAEVGRTISLGGSSPDTGTVRILFRKRGQDRFTVRRTIATPDHAFRTSFVVDDDYRWAAQTDRCDSAQGTTQAVPVVTGPARVHRGDTVRLTVKAPVGARTLLFFRGPGEPYAPRRVFTGPGTTTYVATTDQRYYPRTSSTQGTGRLTQVVR